MLFLLVSNNIRTFCVAPPGRKWGLKNSDNASLKDRAAVQLLNGKDRIEELFWMSIETIGRVGKRWKDSVYVFLFEPSVPASEKKRSDHQNLMYRDLNRLPVVRRLSDLPMSSAPAPIEEKGQVVSLPLSSFGRKIGCLKRMPNCLSLIFWPFYFKSPQDLQKKDRRVEEAKTRELPTPSSVNSVETYKGTQSWLGWTISYFSSINLNGSASKVGDPGSVYADVRFFA